MKCLIVNVCIIARQITLLWCDQRDFTPEKTLRCHIAVQYFIDTNNTVTLHIIRSPYYGLYIIYQ